jgi:nucleolar GTP-binding protein
MIARTMNFQNLPTVETYDKYLDHAFSRAKERALIVKSGKKDKLAALRDAEKARLDLIGNYLCDTFYHLEKSYPSVNDAPIFYRELMRVSFDVGEFRRSMAALRWCATTVRRMVRSYASRIVRARGFPEIHALRSEYYGRISSIVKQINANLKFIQSCRRILKGFPDIKTSVRSIAIVGFPNVGKTTLLQKLTGSTAEIANYAFTTKGINVSYNNTDGEKLQYIDTPGSLNRKKLNPIEMQSDLILQYVAEEIIFVLDVSESSYPLSDQITLLDHLIKFGKPLKIYLSKTDMNPEAVPAVKKMVGKHPLFTI